MASTPFLTAGRLLISLVAISNAVSPYLADMNVTHVYNPNWPPHARFHNGQTMSMGAALGTLTLYYTWRTSANSKAETIKNSLFSAALTASVYWITGLSAGLYPGAAAFDPEFLGTNYEVRLLGMPGQIVVFSVHWALAWVGYAIAMSGLGEQGIKVQ